MAVSIPIVTEFQNDGIKQAMKAFSDIRKSVAEAEGTMGKFKAGGKAAFDAVKANAASFAAAGASAFATFAIKGVQAFQDLALASDKFAGATGLAVEEASRLLEVTGDLAIDAGTVESAIGKMNQNLGKSPDLFEKLGVQVAYANDGTVDANETFLNVIDRLNKIKDPAERARVATQLLGKGWRDMSQLITMGADNLRASLASVSDAKTITREEAEKAKKFRDTMNDLKDVVEDLALSIGQYLVPRLQQDADGAKELAPYFDVAGASVDVFSAKLVGTPTDQLAANMNMARAALSFFGVEVGKKENTDGLINLGNYVLTASQNIDQMNQETLNAIDYGKTNPFKATAASANKLANELKNVAERWDIITGKFDQTVAFDNAAAQLAILEAAAQKAFSTGAKDDIVAYNDAAANFAGTISAIAEGLGKIASREIAITFTAKGPAAALALASYYRSGAELSGLTANQLIGQSGFSFGVPGRASGGSVTAGGTYLVGEQGPELLTMGARGGYVTPNGAMGGSTVNVTVTSADPNQVVAAIQQWTRNNGAIPLTTTANVRR